jgi:hypothetical protein
MYHVGAFRSSENPASAYTFVDAVAEQVAYTNGNDYRVPDFVPNLCGAAVAAVEAELIGARLESPALRQNANYDIEPLQIGAEAFELCPAIDLFPLSPIPLGVDEGLNLAVNSSHADASVFGGLVFLCDGPLAPATGQMFSVRATAAITQVAATWVFGALTFSQVLPVGQYQVVGMSLRAASGLAGRLIFVGQNARPGCPVRLTIESTEHPAFRKGGMGVWGQFHSTTPPSLEMLSGTATAQVVILDLVRVG